MADYNVSNFPKRRMQPFQPFSPADWPWEEPPAREFLVDGCFTPGTVAMVSGDGGLGKSLLMLQLQAASALNQPWLGLETRSVKSFGFYCEDDTAELKRRMYDICRHYNTDYSALAEQVSMVSRVGADDNVLIQADRHGNVFPTPVYDQLMTHVTDFGAQLIILDTLADIFDGNEIVRSTARKCITLLRKLAVKTQGCVILTAHPSLTGLNSGSGMSGSTGWNGAVRQRLYLTRVRADMDDSEEDNDERLLKTMKNNYGPDGGKVRIKWDHGVFIRIDGGLTGPTNIVDRLDADRHIMQALRDLVTNGTRVSADKHNPRTGFANIIRTSPACKNLPFGYVEAAKDRLIESKKIVRVELGPPSKRYIYLRPSDMTYPGERTEGNQSASLFDKPGEGKTDG